MKKLHVKMTFTEAVLGTWPSNQNIAREFIASKSPDAASIEDEVAALGADAVADKGMTVFPRDEEGRPVLYDYQVKGFFKDSCGMLSRIGGKTETGKKRAVNESGKNFGSQEGYRWTDFRTAAHDPHRDERRNAGLPAAAAGSDRSGRAGEPGQQRGDPGRKSVRV